MAPWRVLLKPCLRKEPSVNNKVAFLCVLVVFDLFVGSVPGRAAQSGQATVDCARERKVMKGRISGKFDVKLTRQAPSSDGADGGFGRMLIDKKFHGDLEAVSKGQMIFEGTAAYVALERVEGTLQGCKGTFVLQHTAMMDRGKPHLTVVVVPGSGTDQLHGLSGSMSIRIEGDAHFYDFEYTIRSEERRVGKECRL